jgi:hypothetical protein
MAGKKLDKKHRNVLYRLCRMSPKLSKRKTARALGVSHSTVIRELERNSKVVGRHDDYGGFEGTDRRLKVGTDKKITLQIRCFGGIEAEATILTRKRPTGGRLQSQPLQPLDELEGCGGAP